MAFKWNDYQEVVALTKSLINKPNQDLIAFMFDNFSNKDEEGFEEAWEAMMMDVIVLLKAKQSGIRNTIKEFYSQISQESESQIEKVGAGYLPESGTIGNILSSIDVKKAELLMIDRTIAKAEDLAKPNWLKRAINK